MAFMNKIRVFWARRKQGQALLRDTDYSRPILEQADANMMLLSRIKSGEPFMASRLGGIELNCLWYFMNNRPGERPYPAGIADALGNFAGFFPLTGDALDEFCKVYLDAVRQADAMGVWLYVNENRVLMDYCPNAALMQPRALEPYYHSEPWSAALRGKRVLVVHPFAESIREQYENKRTLLFENPEVLPEFHLHTIRAVQSIAGEPTSFATWFDALDSMKAAMDAVEYDVCIIGAGAYGLPLAAHAKRSGRSAIHMGGATQILFGIKGRRWDDHEVISKLYNEAWVRPQAGETPQSFTTVEDGCYW